jgi:hypothetical protein
MPVTCAVNFKALLLPLCTNPGADVTWLKEAFGLLKICGDSYVTSRVVMKSHDRMADLVHEENKYFAAVGIYTVN